MNKIKKILKDSYKTVFECQKPKRLFKTFVIIAWLLAAGAILTLGGNVVVKDGQLNITDDFFVDTDVLFVDTTDNKVGIGTTSPTQKLEVVGNINATGTVYAHNFSGSSPVIFLNSSGEESVRIEDNGSITATSFVGDGSLLTGIAGIPTGVIVMWSGTYNNIPSGWHLCDGTSGTPDLRNRFIYGVNTSYGAGNDGDLNTTGGASTHTHDMGGALVHFAAPNINLVTADVTAPFEFGLSGYYFSSETDGSVNLLLYITATADAGGSVYPARTASGETTDTAGTVPPYYKLAYIMKT